MLLKGYRKGLEGLRFRVQRVGFRVLPMVAHVPIKMGFAADMFSLLPCLKGPGY